jgi:hypothetical protein
MIMHRLAKTSILLLSILVLRPGSINAQSTSSPYSIFGIGILEGSSVGPSKGMGGTGIAFLSEMSINSMNPASYCGLDSLLTIFEVGIFGKYSTFTTVHDYQTDANANLKYVLMGFRINHWLATSFGFSPYSSIGYNINATAPVEGTAHEYLETFSGSGGVNQIYAGASAKILKNLSIGVNAAYLFGNITRIESSDAFNYIYKDVTYVSNFDFNYGLNYQINIKKWRYNLGLIYSRSKDLRTKNTTTIETATGTETLKEYTYNYSIPQTLGAGIAISKGFFRAGIDFERSDWKDIEFSNVYFQTRNSNRYSFGTEFALPGERKGTLKMIFLRFGGEYRQSYLIVNNVPINCGAVTFGTGLPLKGTLNAINVALELGNIGTTTGGLIRENYIGLHLDMSLRALWFEKRKYN